MTTVACLTIFYCNYSQRQCPPWQPGKCYSNSFILLIYLRIWTRPTLLWNILIYLRIWTRPTLLWKRLTLSSSFQFFLVFLLTHSTTSHFSISESRIFFSSELAWRKSLCTLLYTTKNRGQALASPKTCFCAGIMLNTCPILRFDCSKNTYPNTQHWVPTLLHCVSVRYA